MNRPTLLIFSRDPGPTNVMISIHEQLSDSAVCARSSAGFQRFAADVTQGIPPDFVIYGKDQAMERWRVTGHEARDWNATVPAQSSAAERDAAIMELLSCEGITAIVTGTSDIDEYTDRALWRAARALDIPSHVFLDHSANLDRRFTNRDGTKTYPDVVYAPDSGYRDALIVTGFPAARVRIIGDLQFERMRQIGKRVSATETSALRARWGADQETEIVLFASECTAEMAALGRPSPYSEFATLKRLIANIEADLPIDGRRIGSRRSLLVIRPHPRDLRGKYDAYATLDDSPRIVVSSDGTPAQAILAADLVVGMDSTLLFEADALGQAVVSLVPSSSFSHYIQGKERCE